MIYSLNVLYFGRHFEVSLSLIVLQYILLSDNLAICGFHAKWNVIITQYSMVALELG